MDKTDLTPEQQDAINALRAFSSISELMNKHWKSQPEGSYAKKMMLKAIRRLDVVEDSIQERISEVAPDVDLATLVYDFLLTPDDERTKQSQS